MLADGTYLDLRTGWVERCDVVKLNVAFYFV